MIHESGIRYLTPRDNYPRLEGRLKREVIEENTLDILEYAHLSMYETIYYWNPDVFDKFTHSGEHIENYLIVDQDRGQ